MPYKIALGRYAFAQCQVVRTRQLPSPGPGHCRPVVPLCLTNLFSVQVLRCCCGGDACRFAADCCQNGVACCGEVCRVGAQCCGELCHTLGNGCANCLCHGGFCRAMECVGGCLKSGFDSAVGCCCSARLCLRDPCSAESHAPACCRCVGDCICGTCNLCLDCLACCCRGWYCHDRCYGDCYYSGRHRPHGLRSRYGYRLQRQLHFDFTLYRGNPSRLQPPDARENITNASGFPIYHNWVATAGDSWYCGEHFQIGEQSSVCGIPPVFF
jgi:hypothetical protein